MPYTTFNRGLRVPLLSELAGPDDIQQLATDLDTAFTTTDGLRTAAARRPRACVYNPTAASQSLAKNTKQQATLSTVFYDTNNMADTANNQLVCRTAGVYLVVGGVDYQSIGQPNPDDGASVAVAISRNNVTTEPSQDFVVYKPLPTNASWRLTVGHLFVLAVNDTLRVYQFWTGTNPAGSQSVGSQILTAFMVCTNP